MILSVEILFSFILWYFFEFPKNIFEAWKNFLKFGIHYFSIPFLFKTLFSHWRKYIFSYPRGFDLPKILEVWFANQISRILGATVRTFLIFTGILFEIFVFLFGLILFFCWFFLPFLLIFLLIYGFRLLFSI